MAMSSKTTSGLIAPDGLNGFVAVGAFGLDPVAGQGFDEGANTGANQQLVVGENYTYRFHIGARISQE
jgi:hypothetical protein